MGLAFIPVYIKLMGVESYGLLGFFATLQTMFALLDMGLGTTLTREMARLSVSPGRQQEMRNLVRSLEIIYWGVAALIALLVAGAAPFIAHHWIRASALSPATVQQAILLMGFVLALQWPSALYMGGLVGLQRQVVLNAVNAGMSTLRYAGAVLVLWLVSPTIGTYLIWQGVTTALSTCVLAAFFWSRIPRAPIRATFQRSLLVGIWRFAAGMSAVSVLALLLTQVDKIILSRALSLRDFGYYSVATTVAASLSRLFTPVFYSLYPRFTQLATVGDESALRSLYHKSCEFMSVLILPIAAVVSLFSYDLLLLWTRDPALAERTYLLLALLVWGTALNGVMNPPYALQLAYGWTRLNIATNTVAVIFLVPLIIYLTLHFGATGAAFAWLILNVGYVLFLPPVMHRRLLSGEMWHWYGRDVALPLFTALAIAGLGRLALSHDVGSRWTVLGIAVTSAATLGGAAISAPAIRSMILTQFQRRPFVMLAGTRRG